MRLFWALVVTVAGTAFAGPSGPTSLELPRRPIAEELAPTHTSPRTLPRPTLESVVLRLPRYSDVADGSAWLGLVAPRQAAPGSHWVDYRGVQGFLVRKLQGRFRSLWRQQLRLQFREGAMNEFDVQAHDQRMHEAFADLRGGRWGDRSWLESRVPERGGAPRVPTVEEVGEDLNIIDLGPISLSNSFRARVDRVAFSLDPDPVRSYRDWRELEHGRASDEATLERAVLDPHDPDDQPPPGQTYGHPIPQTDIGFELDAAEPRLWENTTWRFKVRPALGVRLPSDFDMGAVINKLSLRGELELYYGARREKVGRLEVEVIYRPVRNDLRAQVQIQLLSW